MSLSVVQKLAGKSFLGPREEPRPSRLEFPEKALFCFLFLLFWLPCSEVYPYGDSDDGDKGN